MRIAESARAEPRGDCARASSLTLISATVELREAPAIPLNLLMSCRCTLRSSFGLVAGILQALAEGSGNLPKDDIAHREQLADAVAKLHAALVSD
jgi:hypothetical protein